MFTQHDKKFELAKYIASRPESMLTIENAHCLHEQRGVAVAKTFTYTLERIQIKYSKWIVEDFDDARQMKLPGHELHNKPIKSFGVRFICETPGRFYTFHNQEATDIINLCESNHMGQILKLTNNLQR